MSDDANISAIKEEDIDVASMSFDVSKWSYNVETKGDVDGKYLYQKYIIASGSRDEYKSEFGDYTYLPLSRVREIEITISVLGYDEDYGIIEDNIVSYPKLGFLKYYKEDKELGPEFYGASIAVKKEVFKELHNALLVKSDNIGLNIEIGVTGFEGGFITIEENKWDGKNPSALIIIEFSFYLYSLFNANGARNEEIL